MDIRENNALNQFKVSYFFVNEKVTNLFVLCILCYLLFTQKKIKFIVYLTGIIYGGYNNV